MLIAMSDSKIEALSRVPLFSQLSKHELEFVASRADEVKVKAGQELTRQGTPGDSFYILLDGEADVKVDGQTRPTMKIGNFFGEISMLDRGLASATVTAKTDARLFVMSHAQFRDAIKASDELLVKVMAAMGERLRADLHSRHSIDSIPSPLRGEGQGEGLKLASVPSPLRGEGQGEGLKLAKPSPPSAP
jgi:CRP-like cAMP-binding protein